MIYLTVLFVTNRQKYHIVTIIIDFDEKIRNVILFGSVARNDFSDESDIDIFIDSTHNIEQDVNKILSIITKIEILDLVLDFVII